MSLDVVVDDLRAFARIPALPPEVGRVRPNLALRDQLAATHQAAYSLDVTDVSEPAPSSAEGKLLRAIFGEEATVADGELIAEGSEVAHGDQLFRHAQGSAAFMKSHAGTVELAQRSSTDLPSGIALRFVVRVS